MERGVLLKMYSLEKFETNFSHGGWEGVEGSMVDNLNFDNLSDLMLAFYGAKTPKVWGSLVENNFKVRFKPNEKEKDNLKEILKKLINQTFICSGVSQINYFFKQTVIVPPILLLRYP